MTSSHLWNNFITINSLACSFWNTVFLSQFFFSESYSSVQIFKKYSLIEDCSQPLFTLFWIPFCILGCGNLYSSEFLASWFLVGLCQWMVGEALTSALVQRFSKELLSCHQQSENFDPSRWSWCPHWHFFSGVPSKYLLCCSTISGVSSSQEASPLHCGLQGNKPLPLIPQQCRSRLFHAVSNVLSTKLFPFALLGLPTSVQPVLGIKFPLFEIHKVFSAFFSLNIFLKPVFGSLYRSVIKYRMQYLIHNYTKILFIAYYFELDVLYYYLLNLIAIWLYSLSTCSFYYGKGVAYTADRDVLLVAFCMRFSTYFLR